MSQHICRVLSAAVLPLLFLVGCEPAETESQVPGDGPSLTPVAFSILLQDTPGYNSPESASPSTRNGEPLLSEWVKVNTFSATRSGQESDPDGPQFAAMELFEDKVSDSPQTRATMQTGIYFRLIVFKKSGNDYIFHSVSDYASDGSSAPVLRQGSSVKILPGQTVRFVAYSFNNGDEMGSLPASYTWKSTSIPIPDLTNDFLTYDSGDVTPTGDSISLGVSFIHRLCRLTVQISAMGFSSNAFSNCTGVYVKQGGSSSSWTVGGSTVSANTSNTATFNIPDNSTNTSVRLVPFASARPITVHFSTLTVGGKPVNYIDVTSSQSVQLQAGKSYTMTVRFEMTIGTKVAVEDITLSNPDSPCTEQDKIDLSRLRWAPGNLRQTKDNGTGATIFANPTGYGHYYLFKSIYTGNNTPFTTDPCTTLDAATCGSGWRTPTKNELEKLSRCTDRQAVSNNGVNGMWFMNNITGLFLPVAGYRLSSGTTPEVSDGTKAYYWSSDIDAGNLAWYVFFQDGKIQLFSGTIGVTGNSVRCVKP